MQHAVMHEGVPPASWSRVHWCRCRRSSPTRPSGGPTVAQAFVKMGSDVPYWRSRPRRDGSEADARNVLTPTLTLGSR